MLRFYRNINQQLENPRVEFNNYVIHVKILSQYKSKETNINSVVLGYFKFRIMGFGSYGKETWLGYFRFRIMGFGPCGKENGARFVENKKKRAMGQFHTRQGGSLGNLETL